MRARPFPPTTNVPSAARVRKYLKKSPVEFSRENNVKQRGGRFPYRKYPPFSAPAWPERAGAGGYFSVLAKLRRQTPERVYSQPSGTEMEGATAQAAYSP